MDLELTRRLLVALAVVATGLIAYWLANRFSLRNAAAMIRSLDEYHAGRPAILYFTTPACVPCRTVQKPAIDALKERLDGVLQVVEIDASTKPELAAAWGVLSVPTTFVIDARGKPLRVNHGVATTEKLYSQLKEIVS
jgi:thiol-disulfide isomerase/thioredoxin